jgi:hypothetical protein
VVKSDPITSLAMLVMAGKAMRYDNEYEQHYPENKDRFVAIVNNRIRLLRSITGE